MAALEGKDDIHRVETPFERVKRLGIFNTFKTTVNQKLMHFLQQTDLNSRAFNLPVSIKLTSQHPINVSTLTSNIRFLISHNEMLRVTLQQFKIGHGVTDLVQMTSPTDFVKCYSILDLSNKTTNESEAATLKEMEQFVRTPLQEEQLFDFRLIIINPQFILLLIITHRIISDDLSMVTLIDEVLGHWDYRIDRDKMTTVKHQLSLIPPNLSSADKLNHINKWKKMISGTRHTLRFSDPQQPFIKECEHVRFPLGASVQSTLQKLAKKLSTEPTKLVHLILGCVLGAFVGMDDFIVGMMCRNRLNEELNFMGCYEKTLPLRINFAHSPTLKELVSQFEENIRLINESPMHMIDLVNHIPSLEHKPGQPSPLHVILSDYVNEEYIPKTVTLDGHEVKVEVNRSTLQVHTHVDLMVKVYPWDFHCKPHYDSISVHYQYSKGGLSKDLVNTLHDKMADYIVEIGKEKDLLAAPTGPLKAARDKKPPKGPDQEISLKFLAFLSNLSKWHYSSLSKLLPPLDLPTNVLSVPRALNICQDHEYVQIKTDFTGEHSTDEVLMLGWLAYVVCHYTNQDKIGIVHINERKVFGLCFVKLAGTLDMFNKQFTDMMNRARKSKTEVPFLEFSYMMEVASKRMKTSYLVWCTDDTHPKILSCDCGIHVNFSRHRPRGQHVVTTLKFTARAPWFDHNALDTLVQAFRIFYKNINTMTTEEIQNIPYWSPKVSVSTHPITSSNLNLEEPYIQLFMDFEFENPFLTAMTHENAHMTYQYMLQKVTNLAVFIDEEIHAGPVIAIYMPRSMWMFISMFACLFLFRTYLPIGWRTTKEDFVKLVIEYRINLILTESTMLEKLITIGEKLVEMEVEVMCIDALDLSSQDHHSHLPALEYKITQIMCVQFIPSGSSGPRKAIKLTNKNVVHAINNIMDLATTSETRVTLASASITHDAHIIDSLTPLLRGNCIVIVDDLSHIEHVHGITHAFATPSAACCVDLPDTIESLIVGGETFTITCFRKTKHLKKVTRIYGPTECTVFTTSTIEYNPSDRNNIGRIASGYGFEVVNTSGCSVPIGFPGVLYLSGPLLAHGYGKIETSFPYADIVDSTSDVEETPGDKVRPFTFCTKDWVRFLPNQTFELLSMKDTSVQLKGGQRFELLQVENAIRTFRLVKSAYPFLHMQGTPQAVLVAFVTPMKVPVDSLVAHLQKTIPPFMVPKVILTIDRLPLGEHGTIDKARLASLVERRGSIDIGRVDHAVGLLRQICSIFALVVDIRPDLYQPTDNFFKRGGDSVHLLTLALMLSDALECNITVEILLTHSTPALVLEYVTTPISRRFRMPIDNKLQALERKPSAMVERLNTESRLFMKLDKKCTRIEDWHLFPKWMFSPLENMSPESSVNRDKDYIEIVSPLPGKFSLRYLDTIDEDEFEAYTIYLANPQLRMSPMQQYCRSYLPLHYAQMVINPENMHDFEFLKHIPPFRISKEDFQAQNFYRISETLEKEFVLDVTIDIILDYAENCASPEITLLHHSKVHFFTSHYQVSNPVASLHDPVNNETPMFFVHPDVTGFPMSCYGLVLSYGMNAICLRRTINTPATSLEEMATYYVNAIIRVQPKGPYKLIGHLYGASVAYEVAHQLVDMGHKIQLLAMIHDSPVYERRPPLFDPYGYPLPQSALDPTVFYSYLLALDFPHEALQLSPNKPALDCVINAIVETYPWIFLSKKQLKDLYVNIYRWMKCLWEYKPKPTFTGIDHCLLIRDRAHPFFVSKDFGLSKLVSNPTIVMSYSGMFGPGSETLIMKTVKQYLY